MATITTRAASASKNKGLKTASRQKNITTGESSNCVVCEKIIKDQDSSNKGQDSILCEGDCQGWLHRTCAGISKKAFIEATASDQPFYCHYCRCNLQEEEISQLKITITDLRAELKALKNSAAPPEDEPSNTPRATYASVTNPTTSFSAPPQPSIPSINNPDKKFNVIVYGINECPEGSSRHSRITKDMEDVTTIIQKLDPSVPSNSIRDCVRLGKYTKKKRRPILVKLSRSCEVTAILANRKKLAESPGVSIKPDMSKEERLTESILLKVRWELINSGMERNKIKIRGKSLFLDNRLHGSVIDSKYMPHDTNGNSAAPPNGEANSANQQLDSD